MVKNTSVISVKGNTSGIPPNLYFISPFFAGLMATNSTAVFQCQKYRSILNFLANVILKIDKGYILERTNAVIVLVFYKLLEERKALSVGIAQINLGLNRLYAVSHLSETCTICMLWDKYKAVNHPS